MIGYGYEARNNITVGYNVTNTQQSGSFIAENGSSVDYTVSDSVSVNISVYNISGQKVATLINTTNHNAGKYTATLDARKLTPGIYFCRMETENFSETKKMVMLK